jgi:hypothetical protein
VIFSAYLFFDPFNNVLAVLFPTVDEQPARALRHMPADDQHSECKQRTQTEGHRQPIEGLTIVGFSWTADDMSFPPYIGNLRKRVSPLPTASQAYAARLRPCVPSLR